MSDLLIKLSALYLFNKNHNSDNSSMLHVHLIKQSYPLPVALRLEIYKSRMK